MSEQFFGSFVLVLHTHLPLALKHDRMDEEWIFEGAAETYIPLLNIFNRLVKEGISPKVTIGLSPVLAEQLVHPHFIHGFKEYCQSKIDYAQKDEKEFESGNPLMAELARGWQKFYTKTLSYFKERYQENLINAFKILQDDGHIEIMSCAATHPYLPALSEDTSIQAQVKMAVKSYQRLFGTAPQGMWLPECGYRPPGQWQNPVPARHDEPPRRRKGLEEFLSENGIAYFVVDDHQLQKAFPPDLNKTPFDTYFVSGAQIPKQPVTIFARDTGLSVQVWRHQVGYPGDGVYLDFHKKHAAGRLRYWKITAADLDLAYKQIYYPDDALKYRVPEHAGHYKWLIKESLKANFYNTGRAKLAMTAFDTELFGHWWFEGPLWLYNVIKWINQDPEIDMCTCREYVKRDPAFNFVALPESSWGNHFDSSTWINPEVYWVLDRVHQAEHEIKRLAEEFAFHQDDATLRRILDHAVRELLFLQASDWEFMITNWSTRDHAERRVVEHFEDFKRVVKMAWDYGHGRPVPQSDWDYLSSLEYCREIFPDPDIAWYAGLQAPRVSGG
ncbi:MAG: DUF1957 domain-containing protein [Acidobacteria bacterium]|nr:DUF1957 domain-containing protein [Acidobacteriota bacterium]MBI3655056.1 DUF1957 domain-containing protein [Acidobacteriota bacterium]